MRLLKPKVKLLLLHGVKQAYGDRLVKASDVAEDIVWLNQLAENVVSPGGRVPAFCDPVASLGDLTFHSLTIGSRNWMMNVAGKIITGNAEMEFYCLCLALLYARDRSYLESLNTKGRIERAILKFRMVTAWRYTINEIQAAIEKIVGGSEAVDTDGTEPPEVRSADYGDIVAQLCASYGYTPDYVLWSLSDEDVAKLIAKAPVPFGMTRDEQAETKQAEDEFRAAVRHIKAKA